MLIRVLDTACIARLLSEENSDDLLWRQSRTLPLVPQLFFPTEIKASENNTFITIIVIFTIFSGISSSGKIKESQNRDT